MSSWMSRAGNCVTWRIVRFSLEGRKRRWLVSFDMIFYDINMLLLCYDYDL